MFKFEQMNCSGEDFLAPVEDLDEIHYAINVIDEGSRTRGTFAYDLYLFDVGLGFWAISPVFFDVDRFYMWAKNSKFLYHRRGELMTMSRYFE